MDIEKIVDGAQKVAQNRGGVQNVPSVAQAVGAAQGVVKQVKAKADAAGLGGAFDQLANAAEQKLGMDLDGDKGVIKKK